MDKSFVIFDRRSGRILATHTQAAVEGDDENVDLDELRHSYRATPGEEIAVDDLDVLDVDLDLLRRGASNSSMVVDVDSRRIVEQPASDADR